MTTPHRDLALVDPWQRSLERSLHRRAITPAVRRSVARRRRASVALSTLMVAGPTGSLLAAAGFGIGGRGVEVAAASPASRAIDNGATPAAMAFKLGSRGDAVAEIQRQLGVAADGIFGPLTQGAVTDFQARNGLEVDGIVGPVTWTALFGLERAAKAAGAADGNVAVIVRERTGDQDGGNDVGGPNGAGDTPGATGPADAPRTRPVSTPSPGNGACGPLRLASPVKGTVTSGYGPRWGRNHDGLDIAAPTGTPIRAAECGVVSFAGVQSGYGNMVCVKHSSRFETCYAHMTRYAVSQGQRVDRGDVIGYVGCTGNCTGPHLHFETRVDGSARDPWPYLGGGSVPGAPTVKAAAKPKLMASIRKDVARARVTAKTTLAQPRATTGLAPASQQPPATTAAPDVPAYQAPPATHEAPSAQAAPTPTPAPAPAPTAAPVATPTPADAPAPVYDTSAPAAPTTSPEPTYTPAQPPPAEPAPPASPAPEPTPAPVEQQPAPVTTPDPAAVAPPVETPTTPAPTDPPPAETPDPVPSPTTP